MAPSRALIRAINCAAVRPTAASMPLRSLRVTSRSIYTLSRTSCYPPRMHNTLSQPRRCQSTEASASQSPIQAPDHLSQGELDIFNKVKQELDPIKLEVQDVSGGCGSMYAIEITSPKFKGLTVIKQHKLVNQVLAEDIKKWHGVQLRTSAP